MCYTYLRTSPYTSFSYVYRLSESAATAVAPYPEHYYFKDNVLYAYSNQTRSIVKVEEGNHTSLLPPSEILSSFRGEVNSKVLLAVGDSSATDGWETKLYETDGTAAGTRFISGIADVSTLSLRPASYTKGRSIFIRNGALTGEELYRYDGDRVSLVADVVPGKKGLSNVSFYIYEEGLYI